MITLPLLASLVLVQDTVPLAVIPQPVNLTPGTGMFTLTAQTVIWTDRVSARLGHQLAELLEPATGFPLDVQVGGTRTGSRISLRRDTSLKRLGLEGYRLEVSPTRVLIRAPELAGVFYGIQTLRQLLPPEIFRDAAFDGVRWTVPAVTVEDWPRFPWRGGHLDVCRHFMPKEFVKKYIDLLALHKMNSFHWHLTEDQGWRIEITKYPRLTDVGAWRAQTLVGPYTEDSTTWVFDGERHGGYYTQDDIREIVAYAKERFVTVVPEIEMPGHSQAAIAAYPWLGNTGDSVPVLGRWGVSANILKPSDSTIAFYQDVLTEVLQLFPGPFIHVGGDEALKDQWKASPWVQARIKELGLANEEEMQSWFIRQMDAWLAARGRRLVGWDEILEGGLAPGATVMSWRGTEGGIAAARAGHDVVMAPGSHTYFDHYQSQNRAAEPLAIGGFTPLEKAYAFDPVPAELEPQYRRHILGAQGQVWTEYIKGPKQVEYMAYPRMTALAEVLWTPPAQKNYEDFVGRLRTHLRRLDILDVNYRPLGP
ncbi:MAG: beta-N-acetylhexosaminidase [Gemmatimonadetes bacterium]|nr:beta-N-acetylhexosaminidase [Gemmatimonadota bacterium]